MISQLSFLGKFTVVLGAATIAATPLAANVQSPPRLQDFTLQPDDKPKEEPPSKVQGPVADGQRPRDLTQPEPQQQTIPQNTPPVRQAPAPSRVQPAPQSQRPVPQTPPAQQRPTQSQPSPTQQTQTAPEISAPTAQDSAANDNSEAAAADTTTPTLPVADDSAPQITPDASTENTGLSSTLWALIALAIAAMGAVAFIMLRRRKAVADGYDKVAPAENKPDALQPSPPVNLGGQAKITPQPQTAPIPQPKEDDGGFVTSSLRVAPQPQSQPTPPRTAAPRPVQPQTASYTPAPAASNSVGDMRVEFIAKTAGSTMMNAVLGYSIKLHNEGGSAMSNIVLHGTMEQASGGAQTAPDIHMQPLHTLDIIAANGAEELNGDIRVPLAGIKPIAFNNQALFVPVAHFIIEYEDADGKAHREHHAFIVGREHQPPREKMAPFRLDQGPGNFRPVGQRVLAT